MVIGGDSLKVECLQATLMYCKFYHNLTDNHITSRVIYTCLLYLKSLKVYYIRCLHKVQLKKTTLSWSLLLTALSWSTHSTATKCVIPFFFFCIFNICIVNTLVYFSFRSLMWINIKCFQTAASVDKDLRECSHIKLSKAEMCFSSYFCRQTFF